MVEERRGEVRAAMLVGAFVRGEIRQKLTAWAHVRGWEIDIEEEKGMLESVLTITFSDVPESEMREIKEVFDRPRIH